MKKALVFKPEYYDNFSCKSSSCRQTCCAGWAITLSKEEYRKIQNSIRDEEMFDTRTYFEKMPPSQRNILLYNMRFTVGMRIIFMII